MDSLLSIVQMPAGVPVGTLAIGRAGAVNAALLAAAILARARRGRPRAARRATGPSRRSRCSTRPIRLHDRLPVTLVACIGGGQLGRMLGARGAAARARVPLPRSVARTRPPREVGELVVGAYDDPARSNGWRRAPTSSRTSSRTSRSRRSARAGATPAAARARARPGPARREGAVPAARDPDGALRLARRHRPAGARQVAAARLRRQGPAAPRGAGAGRRRRARGGARPLRPRAFDHRRARPRR